MSTLRVDNITGRLDDTTINQPITFSANTATLNSGVVFPAGHVIQTKSGSHNTESYTESTGFVTCNLTVTITPTNTSSKFFIICNTSGYNNGGDGQVGYYTIYRDSTDLGDTVHLGYANIYQGSSHPAGADLGTNICISELDSPNTTSAITYGLYARTNSASHRVYWSMNNSTSNITVMEIAG